MNQITPQALNWVTLSGSVRCLDGPSMVVLILEKADTFMRVMELRNS